jgi:hypothetical protein
MPGLVAKLLLQIDREKTAECGRPRGLRQLSFFGCCLLLAFLSGCCSTRSCLDAGSSVGKYQFQTETFRQALAGWAEPVPQNLDMLILSGGGSHGAWGAGVLRGWRENPDNPRPARFRVVTGVSTGALLATYAFLGQPADDDLLESAYTLLKTSDIYRKKFLLSALFSDSLYRSQPLERVISKYITTNTLDRVARAARDEHRRLYVGTVNLDSGRLVIWDLTAIALDDANPNRLKPYRKVVFASASIPIMVPPVAIDGHLYADGGTRAQLFFQRNFLPALRRLPPSQRPDLTFHIIVNGKIGVATNCVRDRLPSIALRTLDLLLDANELGNLYQIDYVRDAIGFGKLRLCFIPPDFEVTSSAVFDPPMLRKLYDKGREFGRTTRQWTSRIPDPDFGQPSPVLRQ